MTSRLIELENTKGITKETLNRMKKSLRETWSAESYKLGSHNCNHFTVEFISIFTECPKEIIEEVDELNHSYGLEKTKQIGNIFKNCLTVLFILIL